jgi:predicted Fe-Mo cluster-binding NifX family protein
MKIVVSAQSEGLEALTSPVFGRCPVYMMVDTETMDAQAVGNPAMAQGGGAGIQAAQFVVSQGAEAVLTGNLGPNAFEVLQAASIPAYQVPEGSVNNAVLAFRSGQLQPMGSANVAAHSGMGGTVTPPEVGQGREARMSSGASAGWGRGSNMGQRRGLSRGMGRGRGMGKGFGQGRGTPSEPIYGGAMPVPPMPQGPQPGGQSELAELRQTLKYLQQQLAQTMARIEQLEGMD